MAAKVAKGSGGLVSKWVRCGWGLEGNWLAVGGGDMRASSNVCARTMPKLAASSSGPLRSVAGSCAPLAAAVRRPSRRCSEHLNGWPPFKLPAGVQSGPLQPAAEGTDSV